MIVSAYDPVTRKLVERDVDPTEHSNAVRADGRRWWLTPAETAAVVAEQAAIQAALASAPLSARISPDDARRLIDRDLLAAFDAGQQEEIRALAARADAELVRRAKGEPLSIA